MDEALRGPSWQPAKPKTVLPTRSWGLTLAYVAECRRTSAIRPLPSTKDISPGNEGRRNKEIDVNG